VPLWIEDFAGRAIYSGQGCFTSPAQLNPVELHLYAEIDRDLPDRIAEIFQRAFRIRTGIADDNGPAPPTDHLVETEVLAMTAVPSEIPRLGSLREPHRPAQYSAEGR